MKEINNFNYIPDYKFENKLNRKIKGYNVYNLIKNEGRVIKVFKKLKINEFRNYMNLNETNRIVGYTPFHIGFRKSSPVIFNNIINKTIFNNLNIIKVKYPRIYKELINSGVNFREVYSGSPDSNTNHLRNFCKDNTKSELNIKDILKICNKSDWFLVPKLSFNDPYEIIFTTNYNPKSTNGLFTSRIIGSNYKASSIETAVVLAIEQYKLISNKALKNYCLWELLAREKDFKVDNIDINKELSTRVVMSTEHHETLLLSWFFQKLMVSIESFSNEKQKFFIKDEYNGSKISKLLDNYERFDYVVDADWSQFDSSIDSDYLIAAGVIMFSDCYDDRKDMRILYHVISSFVTKYVAIPPGVVIELNRGNPSGHPGVTAINCFVNLIRWAIIGFKVYGENYSEMMDIVVYGDDALIFLKNSKNLHKIDSIIKKDLKFECDPIYERLYPTKLISNMMYEGPDYLKRRFSFDGICWNTTKVIDKLIYQSKIRTIDEQVSLIINFIVTAPYDDEFNNFCRLLLNDIRGKYNLSADSLDQINKIKKWVDKSRFKTFFDDYTNRSFYKDLKILNRNIQVLKERYIKEKTANLFINFRYSELKLLFYITNSIQMMNYYKNLYSNINSIKSVNIFTSFGNYKILSRQVFENYFYHNIIKYINGI